MTNVLIVDDEKIEREGLKYLLSREEGERTVFEAANGKQALQVLRSEDIQLLLTDIKMPHMTFKESQRRKSQPPDHHIQRLQRLHLCAGGDPLRCDRIHPQTGKSG